MNQKLTDSTMESVFTKNITEEVTQKLALKVDNWIDEKIREGLRNKGYVCDSSLELQILKSSGVELECRSKKNPHRLFYEDTYLVNNTPFLMILKNYEREGISLTAYFL